MLAALWLGGCSWVELAYNALTYPTTRSGESANVVVHGDWAYVTKGAAGMEVVHLGRREPSRPKIRQSIPLSEDSLATGVAIASSHIVVAAHGRGTLLFNRTSNTWGLP